MRRVVLLLAVLLVLCCGCGTEEESVVGCWVTESETDYYFQLYEDGTCMMFDANDEWVSSGTYTKHANAIVFETDTGTFTWATDPEEEGTMLFEAGETVFRYRLQEY